MLGAASGDAIARRLSADHDTAFLRRMCGGMLLFLAVSGAVGIGYTAVVGDAVRPVAFVAVGLAAITGAALLAWGGPIPHRVVYSAPAWAAFLIGLTVLSGTGISRALWVVPVACLAYVGRIRAVVVLIGAVGVAFAAGLAFNEQLVAGRPFVEWIYLMTGLTGVAYLVQRLRSGLDAQSGALVSLAQALDLRDTGTASHSTTVGHLSERLAIAAGLPFERCHSVGLAGILHDVGKIGVPDAVLRKPGPLDDEEWVLMRRHVEIGRDIVASAGLEEIAGWIAMHHERLDGTGYPAGLRGDEIPREARILAIVDAYEAMTSDRPYSAARSSTAALAELRREAGSTLDPVLVGLLHDVVREAPDDSRRDRSPRWSRAASQPV